MNRDKSFVDEGGHGLQCEGAQPHAVTGLHHESAVLHPVKELVIMTIADFTQKEGEKATQSACFTF